jgi:hypothetical protein
MQTKLRRFTALALISFMFVVLTPAFISPNNESKLHAVSQSALRASKQAKTLTFADRVAYQRRIQEVHWRHSIWPKERPDPKPPLDAVMSQAQIESQVRDYLRNSQELEDHWQTRITP